MQAIKMSQQFCFCVFEFQTSLTMNGRSPRGTCAKTVKRAVRSNEQFVILTSKNYTGIFSFTCLALVDRAFKMPHRQCYWWHIYFSLLRVEVSFDQTHIFLLYHPFEKNGLVGSESGPISQCKISRGPCHFTGVHPWWKVRWPERCMINKVSLYLPRTTQHWRVQLSSGCAVRRPRCEETGVWRQNPGSVYLWSRVYPSAIYLLCSDDLFWTSNHIRIP